MELIQFFTFSFCKKIGNRTDGKVFGDGMEVEREGGRRRCEWPTNKECLSWPATSTSLYCYLGCEIDDQHRNTNMNNKDHLVGQLASRRHGSGRRCFRSKLLGTNTIMLIIISHNFSSWIFGTWGTWRTHLFWGWKARTSKAWPMTMRIKLWRWCWLWEQTRSWWLVTPSLPLPLRRLASSCILMRRTLSLFGQSRTVQLK